jgi:hydrogenase-4 component F
MIPWLPAVPSEWLAALLSPAWLPWLPVAVPLLSAAVLAAIASAPLGARVNLGAAVLTLPLAVLLLALPEESTGLLRADPLNLCLLLPATLVGISGAVATLALPLPEGAGRAWNAGYQALLGLTHLALLADNMALAWMALALCGPVLALLVALRRGPQDSATALAAAWKAVLVCGAGAALALLGTVVLAMAAEPLAGDTALSFDTLQRVAREVEPGPLMLGFLLMLAGYGILAGLVPLHLWLGDAHAEAPTPLIAIPIALLGQGALHALLRAKAVADLNPGWLPPGALLLLAGLAGTALAALAVWRQRDSGRFLAACAVGQTGLAAIAFGLGGPATMAGLLQMAGSLLGVSAAAFGLGRGARLRGSAGMRALSGLAATERRLGWALAAVLAALAGLPPLALFVSEFLLVQQAVARLPWMALPLGAVLVALAATTLGRLRRLCFGPAPSLGEPRAAGTGHTVFLLMLLHLVGLLGLGMFLPSPLAALLADAARVAG